MDKKTVFIKTDKGEREADSLSSDLKRILMLIDNKSASGDLSKRAPPSLRESWNEILGELVDGGYIRDKNKLHVEPKIVAPKSKFNPLKMFSSKPAETFVNKPVAQPPSDDLDFSVTHAAPVQNAADLDSKQKADEAARARAEREAATIAAAKAKASAEATAKAKAEAEAKARQEAEIAAKTKAVADAKAKQEALIREQAEARAKQEAKARQEAASRMQEQQETSRAKASLESAVRVRAEIETAARAQKDAEAKAKQEAEAVRLKAQHEAARAKAAAEVAARTKAEAEARVRAEIEAAARTKQEAEALRLKAEQEAARVKAELEAVAKAKLEAEAARLKAEETVALARAELEAVKARAEAEAKVMAEMRAIKMAEEKAKHEAEAARLIAEQETARIRAEQEAIARVQTEAEAQARAGVEAKLRAEAEAQAQARKQEAEASANREAEEYAKRVAVLTEQEKLARIAKESSAAPAFEIRLDGFLGGAEQLNQTMAPTTQHGSQERVAVELKARLEAEQRAAAEAMAKAEAELESMKNAAAEMARLKEEAEAARRIAEANARRQAEEQALSEEQTKAWAEAEHRAKAQAILEAEQAAQQAALAQAKSRKKQPVERAHRKPLPLGKIAFGMILLALVVVLVMPYVYPLNEYIAPIEQRLSERLKQPVHIGGLSATSLPPKLQLKNVTVGNSQEIKIGTIELNFDPLTLLSEGKVINNAELADVSINGSMLTKQVESLKQLGGDAQYPVRHLTLQRLKIVTDEVALPSLNGIADIDIKGAFSRISLHSADNKLGFDLQANQGNWQLGVDLKESSLPLFPDIVFSDFSAKGDLSDGEVNFTEMDAHIYNGILLGSAKLNWRKGWQLQGRFEAKTFELNKMFPKFHVEGDMYGEGTFTAAGAKLSQLDDAPRLDGSFTVKKGTVNIDIVETARLLSRDNLVGGRTHFDDMIGLVQLESHSTHIKQLKIVSGMMSASGSFDVSPTNQLTGNLNAEIKMRPGINPLTLYGELAEPKLRAGH